MERGRTLPSSFRDPCGYVFERGGELYRCVRRSYADNYSALMGSGLYEKLASEGLLVAHAEAGGVPLADGDFKIIKPERIPFISYPYEWSFSQLKDAALLTLRVQRLALERGMALRDASAYNVQFRGCRPVLIDTLSFEKHEEGRPWPAYRQFCGHFLAPLAVMALRDIRLGNLQRAYLDGIPLDLAAGLLPLRTAFSPALALHLRLHAKAQKTLARRGGPSLRLGRNAELGLLDSLEGGIRGLNWNPGGTAWAGYYSDNTYTPEAFEAKKRAVARLLAEAGPGPVWDLGANDGTFGRLAPQGVPVLAFDYDPSAVEANYLKARAEDDTRMLPLLMDLFNPSSACGWAGEERGSLAGRGPAGTAMALALLHHLCIAGNVPLGRAAEFFSGICRRLIIEFVPKSDPQAEEMLRRREDIFPGYSEDGFLKAFSAFFSVDKRETLPGSGRTLFLMSAHRGPASRHEARSQA